eukprot:Selendium_serpulae@DN5393_c0_g1_i4.p1
MATDETSGSVPGNVVPSDVKDAPDAPEAEQTSHPEALFEHINMQLRDQLVSMEIHPIRVEKALYYTDSQSLDRALMWVFEHQDDEDIDVPISASAIKAKLSPEEAKKKAVELQKLAKERRLEREKKDAMESEVKRMEYSKRLQSAARDQEECEARKRADELEREKRSKKAETERLTEKLRQEWIEKHGTENGCPYNLVNVDTAETVLKKSKKEQVIYWVNKMVAAHKETDKQGITRCLKRLTGIFENIRNNPAEMKYQKLRKSTNVFSTEIVPFTGAVEIMKAVGFEEIGEFMEMTSGADGFLLGQAN